MFSQNASSLHSNIVLPEYSFLVFEKNILQKPGLEELILNNNYFVVFFILILLTRNTSLFSSNCSWISSQSSLFIVLILFVSTLIFIFFYPFCYFLYYIIFVPLVYLRFFCADKRIEQGFCFFFFEIVSLLVFSSIPPRWGCNLGRFKSAQPGPTRQWVGHGQLQSGPGLNPVQFHQPLQIRLCKLFECPLLICY